MNKRFIRSLQKLGKTDNSISKIITKLETKLGIPSTALGVNQQIHFLYSVLLYLTSGAKKTSEGKNTKCPTHNKTIKMFNLIYSAIIMDRY